MMSAPAAPQRVAVLPLEDLSFSTLADETHLTP